MLSTAVLIVDTEISEQYCKLNLNLLKISTGRRLTSWLLTKRGGVEDRCATLADCRLDTGRLYIVLPIRIYTIYTYTYTYTYIPIPIRSASLANRSSSLGNPSASLQVRSLQVSHTGCKSIYTLFFLIRIYFIRISRLKFAKF